VVLCFGSAITLAAFEWRSPLSESVVTLNAAPNISADAVLNLGRKNAMGGRPVPFDSATAQPTVAEESSPKQRSRFSRWLTFGWSTGADSINPKNAENSTELVLSLESRLLEVRVPGEVPVLYEVAVGHDDWQTPVGEFTVLSKLENPAWQHPITKERIEPGPENPLGARWIGFWSDGQAEIGFHGTNQEDLIGEAVSHGCVRMRNADIQNLYKQVEVGTRVIVKP